MSQCTATALLTASSAMSCPAQSLGGAVGSSRGMCLLFFQVFPHFLLLLSVENVILQVAVAQVPQVPLHQVRIFLQLADQLVVLTGAVTLAGCPWRNWGCLAHLLETTGQGAWWKGQGPQGAETSLAGLGLSWRNSGMAGLPQAAGCVKMTSGRFCLVPLVGQPVFVSLLCCREPPLPPGAGQRAGEQAEDLWRLPRLSSSHGLLVLVLGIVCPRPWWVLAPSHLAPSHLPDPHHLPLLGVSWLFCRGSLEAEPRWAAGTGLSISNRPSPGTPGLYPAGQRRIEAALLGRAGRSTGFLCQCPVAPSPGEAHPTWLWPRRDGWKGRGCWGRERPCRERGPGRAPGCASRCSLASCNLCTNRPLPSPRAEPSLSPAAPVQCEGDGVSRHPPCCH